jgi:hypothetical protein
VPAFISIDRATLYIVSRLKKAYLRTRPLQKTSFTRNKVSGGDGATIYPLRAFAAQPGEEQLIRDLCEMPVSP